MNEICTAFKIKKIKENERIGWYMSPENKNRIEINPLLGQDRKNIFLLFEVDGIIPEELVKEHTAKLIKCYG